MLSPWGKHQPGSWDSRGNDLISKLVIDVPSETVQTHNLVATSSAGMDMQGGADCIPKGRVFVSPQAVAARQGLCLFGEKWSAWLLWYGGYGAGSGEWQLSSGFLATIAFSHLLPTPSTPTLLRPHHPLSTKTSGEWWQMKILHFGISVGFCFDF